MTVRTYIECDGPTCRQELEVDECDSVATTLKGEGWHQDPEDGFAQFCPACWPERKKYLDNYGMDSGLGDDA